MHVICNALQILVSVRVISSGASNFFFGFLYFGGVSNKTLVGYEMIKANSALRASLAIYHLISNARSRNNKL